MSEQSGETNCVHGIGHKSDVHGCDGCCNKKGENKMSELTQEAILTELAKLSDSSGRVIYFHQGQTIVPNSLLEEVWREAERNTTKRIIKLLEESYLVCQGDLKCDACDEWQTFNETDYSICKELIASIKGETK